MRTIALSVVLWLLTIPVPVAAQSVTMPQSVLAVRGRTAQIEITYDGDDLKWSTPAELDVFREWSADDKVVSLRILVPPETPNGNYQIQAVTTKVVDGKARLSKFQTCLVNVGGLPPVTVPPTTPTVPTIPATPTVPAPTTPATSAIWVYEKSQHTLPPPVLSALNRLNRERYIDATLYEQPEGEFVEKASPKYKAILAAAQQVGLPALVVISGSVVIKVVKDPKTEQQVLEAVP